MPTLLRVDCSPLGEDSISRRLTDNFVKVWKVVNPSGEVLTRDLAVTQIPPVNAEWIEARGPLNPSTPGQRAAVKLSDELVDELQAADEYIFGVPMYNFGIPAALKLWIDQVARPGRTFSYEGGTPTGLLRGKKATFLVASGGVYDELSGMARLNFVEPYLKTVFGFLGVTNTTFIHAGGTMSVHLRRMDRESYLQPHLESIQRQLISA